MTSVIQTACRHCDTDIENLAPFKRGEWRDRGNNTHCNDGKRAHAPMAGEIARHKALDRAEAARLKAKAQSVKDSTAIAAIAKVMSGEEWNADTFDEIAEILRHAGYEIKDTE